MSDSTFVALTCGNGGGVFYVRIGAIISIHTAAVVPGNSTVKLVDGVKVQVCGTPEEINRRCQEAIQSVLPNSR